MKPSIAAVLALFAPVPLFAQAHSEQITVNVVEVPVYVERFGRAVEGLTKEDFQLFVNGQPQRIDYFDVIGRTAETRRAAAPQPAEAAAPPLHRRRLYMLVFDALSYHGIRRAREQALALVDQAAPGEAFAVASVRPNGVRVVVPFTTDAIAVKHAIQTLRPSAARDAFSIAMLASERAAWNRTGLLPREGTAGDASTSSLDAPGALRDAGESPFPSRAADAVNEMERFQALVARDVEKSFPAHLGRLAERLAPLSGIKQVVLFSERSTQNLFDFHNTAAAMHRKFQAAGVVLNAVDAGGLKAPWTAGPAFVAPQLGPSELLYALALETGGTAALSAQQLRNMESVTYVLGFHPSGRQRKQNSIRVRLRKAPFGTYVRHRTNYVAGAERSTRDDGLLLADVLLNDIPQHGITTTLAATPRKGGVRLVASVPGAELLPRGREMMLDVYLYLFDAQNVVAEWSYVRMKLDLEKGREYLSAQPYTIERSFALAPGRYAAKALVRVVGSEEVGFARADVVVADEETRSRGR